MFVNGVKIYQFKEKVDDDDDDDDDDDINVSLLCLDNVSKFYLVITWRKLNYMVMFMIFLFIMMLLLLMTF